MIFGNSQHVQTVLMEFSKGDLSPDESQCLAAHLSQCASCRQAHEKMGFAITLLTWSLTAGEAPSDLWPSIESRWNQERRAGRALRLSNHLTSLFRRPLTVFSSAVLIMLGSWLAWRTTPPELNLSSYVQGVDASSANDAFAAVCASAPNFALCEQLEALQAAGLVSASPAPLPGYQMVLHRVDLVGREKLVQLVYAQGQRAFSVFVAPRNVKLKVDGESVIDASVHGMHCRKTDCTREQAYIFRRNDHQYVLVSKSLDPDESAAVMRYFGAARH